MGRMMLMAVLVLVAGCALRPDWHWERAGASGDDLDRDVRLCKQAVYSGTDGNVNNASVRRMHNCMEARGWRKQDN
jgi:hypothetical protein